MQIKATMRCQVTSIKITIIKKAKDKCQQRYGEKGNFNIFDRLYDYGKSMEVI